jgi:alkyldihydroxyacetonephosphate synthase
VTEPHELPSPGPGVPTPPIALRDGGDGATARLDATSVPVPPPVLERLAAICPTSTDAHTLGEASRDWWPQAMIWALDGQVAGRAHAVASPTTAAQVSEVLAVCNDAEIPVTAAAGRSGVCGASVPIHGGVVLDLCGLTGIVEVD